MTAAHFTGTQNPRQLRAIAALERRPMPRESLDREAGCSNSPEMVPDGAVNNAAKLSNQYAATMAALSGKLRLCKSATTRAESAGLKKALQVGPRPWDCDPALEHFFS
jgi:hypothetical protein